MKLYKPSYTQGITVIPSPILSTYTQNIYKNVYGALPKRSQQKTKKYAKKESAKQHKLISTIYDLSNFFKTGNEHASRIFLGRRFQSIGAETEKDLMQSGGISRKSNM